MRLRLVIMRIDKMSLLICSFKRLNAVCSLLKQSEVDNILCFGQYTFYCLFQLLKSRKCILVGAAKIKVPFIVYF